MKNIYTLIALMFAIAISRAQSIPNGGFENWTNHGAYDTPDDWFCYNTMFSTSSVFTCEKGSPGAVGSAFIKLTTREISVGSVFPGFTMSTPGPSSNYSGFAYNLRPQSLTGQYQYLLTGKDSNMILINLTKWNSTTQTQDIIAAGAMVKGVGAVSSWTNFTVPLFYYSGSNPDTAIIIFSSSNGSERIINDYLYIDDLKFTGSVASLDNPLMFGLNVSIAPNPFTTNTTITFNEPQLNTVIRLTDISGKEIFNQIFTGSQYLLEKGDMDEGVYFLELSDGNGNVTTKKIVVY